MKRVLITAGQVYGRLDANKLVGNRVRGLWAVKFAEYLAGLGYPVTLLVPDTFDPKSVAHFYDDFDETDVLYQTGFDNYLEKCHTLALTHDAAVMAAAVVNWIPKEPFPGKMPTKGYRAGDELHIPFILAPRVIDTMRTINPHLTLIGCKMLVDSTDAELLEATYGLLRSSKANVVVANDMGRGLRRKLLVYPDGCTAEHNNDWATFYADLRAVIDDQHWHSEETPGHNHNIVHDPAATRQLERGVFDAVLSKYRPRFRPKGHDGLVYGSVLVPTLDGGYLTTPREKGLMFSALDAVWVPKIDTASRAVTVGRGAKATMNAPLLIRVARWAQQQAQEGSCFALGQPVVLHLHEQLPGVPTVPYAPPGTDRDNLRDIPGPAFNIEGHGFIACLDGNLNIIGTKEEP